MLLLETLHDLGDEVVLVVEMIHDVADFLLALDVGLVVVLGGKAVFLGLAVLRLTNIAEYRQI